MCGLRSSTYPSIHAIVVKAYLQKYVEYNWSIRAKHIVRHPSTTVIGDDDDYSEMVLDGTEVLRFFVFLHWRLSVSRRLVGLPGSRPVTSPADGWVSASRREIRRCAAPGRWNQKKPVTLCTQNVSGACCSLATRANVAPSG